jgi:O-antigen ligase
VKRGSSLRRVSQRWGTVESFGAISEGHCSISTLNHRPGKKPKASAAESPADASFDQRWAWRIGAVAVIVTPLLVSRTGDDAFRLPKDAFFRACGVTIAALLLLGLVWRIRSIPRPAHPRWWSSLTLSVLIVAWTAVSAIASTNPRLSFYSVLWVVSAVVLFHAIEARSESTRYLVLVIGMLPAVLNALVAVLQELRIWNPFIPMELLYNKAGESLTGLRGTIGFLGNPNDVGTYLLPSLVCAVAASVSSQKWRWLYVAIGAIMMAGIIASRSIASFAAAGASFVALAILAQRRLRWILLLALLVGIAGAIAFIPPIRHRAAKMQDLAREGRYDEMVSGRLIGSLTAWEMLKEHPILGVGPGAFGYEFFDHVLLLRRRWPGLFRHVAAVPNFGEAHNDHLQVLAVTGVVGYALMLAAIVFLGSRSFTRGVETDERRRFARVASLPLAVAFSVSALAQFPLELAASLTAYIFYAAMCIAWSK